MGRNGRIAIVAVVLGLAGFVFLRGPTPHITLKPETLHSFGIVNITNTMITSWIVVILIVVGVFLMTRRWELVPRGAQNILEAILEAFYNVVTGIAGEKNGRRFFPVVATIFFFILFANWLSLTPVFNVIGLGEEEEHGFVMKQVDVGPIPLTYTTFSGPGHWGGETIDEDDPQAAQKAEEEKEKGNFVGELKPFLRGINTDLNTPLALAIISAIVVEFWGISTLGFGTYGRKFFNCRRHLPGSAAPLLRRVRPGDNRLLRGLSGVHLGSGEAGQLHLPSIREHVRRGSGHSHVHLPCPFAPDPSLLRLEIVGGNYAGLHLRHPYAGLRDDGSSPRRRPRRRGRGDGPRAGGRPDMTQKVEP